MAEKIEEPVLNVRVWFNGQITIAITRLYSHTIHVDLLPSHLWDRDMYWELGSGLVLVQYIARQNILAHTGAKLLFCLPELKFPSFLQQT